MPNKTCTKCGIEKHLADFVKNKSKKGGLGSYCRTCATANSNAWRNENPDKAKETKDKNRSKPESREKARLYSKNYANENREQYNSNQKRWRESHPEAWMWQVAKQRAKAQGVPFEITKADVVIPAFCPILGIPLSKGDGVTHASSPSLDKIIPELGYVPGNVQVISLRANAMKNDASFADMIALGEWAQSRIMKEG